MIISVSFQPFILYIIGVRKEENSEIGYIRQTRRAQKVGGENQVVEVDSRQPVLVAFVADERIMCSAKTVVDEFAAVHLSGVAVVVVVVEHCAACIHLVSLLCRSLRRLFVARAHHLAARRIVRTEKAFGAFHFYTVRVARKVRLVGHGMNDLQHTC